MINAADAAAGELAVDLHTPQLPGTELSKAEQWSGSGGFGAAAPVSTTSRASAARTSGADDADQRRDELKAELAEAKQELAAARRHRDETRRNLKDAERDLNSATKAYDKAARADRDAAASVEKAQARLRRRR